MKTIVAFDGEGQADRYTVLASSDGECLHRRAGLRALECLEFLTRAELRDCLCIWYSFGYDVNMILKGITDGDFWQGRRTIHWKGYTLRYMPGKILKIKHLGRWTIHYDVFGFFQCSFRKALENWLGVTDEVIEKGKAARGQFSHWPMEDVIAYNQRELVYLTHLGNMLIEMFDSLAIPLKLKSYHGAGAAAGAALNYIHMDDEILEDRRILALSQAAYYGGRIETLQRGSFAGVFHADLKSAYPSAMLHLPDLSQAVWNPTREYRPGQVGIYELEFSASETHLLGSFPVRWPNGLIVYPLAGRGVYWSWEIEAALAQGVSISIKQGYALTHFVSSRLSLMVEALYAMRAEYKRLGDGREKAVKLTLNALYGKLAQRIRGKFSSLTLAGMITSQTRAILYRAACQAPESVIMLSTDGIYAQSALTLDIGPQLGQWESENLATLDVVMNGVYRAVNESGQAESKTRGFTMDSDQFEGIYLELCQRGRSQIVLRRFVTHSLALNQPQAYPTVCAWRQVTRAIEPTTDHKRCWPGSFDGRMQLSAPLPGPYVSVSYQPKLETDLDDLWIDLDDI